MKTDNTVYSLKIKYLKIKNKVLIILFVMIFHFIQMNVL